MIDSPRKALIHYVSAPCGSGKTYAACQHIKRTLYQRNHLYVAPTKELIRQTAQLLRTTFEVPVKVITSDESSSVKREIVEFLKTSRTYGQVLLITLPAYLELPYFCRRENWDIYIDEVPQPDNFYALDVHQNRKLLTNHVTVGNPLHETICSVDASKKGSLKSLLENPDDVTQQLQSFYRDLLSSNRDVFVSTQSWNTFKAGHVSEKRDANKVNFLSMLNPAAFDGCVLLGANIEQSMLYNWFTRVHGVEFTTHEWIGNHLRYTEHPSSCGNRLHIAYLLSDRGHSKRLMDKDINDSGEKYCQRMDREVMEYFGDRRFLCVVNEDYIGELKQCSNVRFIRPMAHGRNDLQQETNIYFGPALNRQPPHQRFLNQLGFSSQEIKSATLHETAYQALMRTNLRVPDSEEIITCIVPEKDTASRLVEIFNGARLKDIGGDEFKKVAPFSKAQRNKRSKLFNIYDALLKVNDDTSKLASDNHDSVCLPQNRDISLIEDSENCPQFVANGSHAESARQVQNMSDAISGANGCAAGHVEITFHQDIRDKDHDLFVECSFGLQDFVKLLRTSAQTIIDNKDELILFNPTSFIRRDLEGFRRQINFRQSLMMVLDFDGGELSIMDFERIFWREAGKGKRSFIICNSFSRSPEKPNHFRVIMFYKSPVTSIELHQAIYDSVLNRLVDCGYTEESAELDRNCRNGVQSFYLPCANRKHSESAYFERFGTSKRDIQRYGIEPSTLHKFIMPTVEKPRVLDVSTNTIYFDDGITKEERIEKILDAVRVLTEGRHDEFYKAGLKLRSMGLDDYEVQFHLEELEQQIGKQREQWARDAMTSLDKPSSGKYAMATDTQKFGGK